MNDKQQMFCKEYIKDLNASAAAVRAGYSEKTARQVGYRLLTNDYIQEEIQRLMDKRAQKVELTAESVLADIMEIKDRCMQKVPVMRFDRVLKMMVHEKEENEDGEEVGLWTFDANGAIRSCELLGKHLKLFTDKIEHGGEIRIPDIIIKRADSD